MAHILQPKLVLNFQFFCRSLLEVQSIAVYCQTSQYSASLLAHSSSAEDLLCAHNSLRADFPPSSSIPSSSAHLSEQNSAYKT